jgi:hypothetical protein
MVVNIFHYLTVWSLFLHILSYFKIIKSTLPLAYFVLFGSIILFWVYPGYYFKYCNKGFKIMFLLFIIDFITHYLPVILLSKKYTLKDTVAVKPIIVLAILYLLLVNKKVFQAYIDPLKHLNII